MSYSNYYDGPEPVPEPHPRWGITCKEVVKFKEPPQWPNASLFCEDPDTREGHHRHDCTIANQVIHPKRASSGELEYAEDLDPASNSFFNPSPVPFESHRRCSWLPLKRMAHADLHHWQRSGREYPLPLPDAPEHQTEIDGIRRSDIIRFLTYEFRLPQMRGEWWTGQGDSADNEGWFRVFQFASFALSARHGFRQDCNFRSFA